MNTKMIFVRPDGKRMYKYNDGTVPIKGHKLPPIRILNVRKYPRDIISPYEDNRDRYIDITAQWQAGVPTAQIANQYGVTYSRIAQITRTVFRRIYRYEFHKHETIILKKKNRLKSLAKTKKNVEEIFADYSGLPTMSVRAWNCLYRAGIQSIEELEYLLNYSENGADFLLSIRNCGRGTAEEILKACGLDKKYQISEKPNIKRVHVQNIHLILKEMREKENG